MWSGSFHMWEVKMDTETVKQYLNSCIPTNRAVQQMESDIVALRSEKMSVSHVLDGMPRGSERKDLSDYMVKLEELEKKLLQARYKRIMVYTRIFDSIEMLPDDLEKELLTYRYLKGYTWDRIADVMQYSYAQIHRIHRRALEHFDVLEDQGEV